MKIERPKITHEIIVIAANKLVKENGWILSKSDDIAKVYRKNMDGYELAKELESNCYWDICAMDVEILDCMDSEVRELHRASCLEWAIDNDIQPTLKVGTMTTQGEITGIYEHDAACYKIRANGETNESRRLIVRFEDAIAA